MSARPLRALTIAILLLAVAAAVPAPADAQLNVTGQWTTLPYLSPLNPIHVALMKNGKVLIVAGSEQNPNATVFKAAVWDPNAGGFSQQLTPWDLFCNGMTFLPDGRVIMTGGNLDIVNPGPGAPWTTIFDPATETFYQLENMAKGRWYPGNAALSDGGTMTFGGLDQNGVTNTTTEIYDLDTGWSAPYPGFNTGWYPRLHLLPNGTVFNSSPNRQSHTFNPASGTWSTGPLTNYTADRHYAASVLLPLSPADGYTPRVVIFGGNTSGATASVEYIDLGSGSPSWVTMPPMSVPRVTMNAVLLPNGKILTLGGSTLYNDSGSAHLNAETFDPVAQTWTPSGSGAYARLYHSVALLLPDATVWVAGSNPGREVWDPHMEIYKPPYLFTATGAPAPRPVIGATPAVVGHGQTFTIGSAQAASIGKVLLMRLGSNTHSFDQEQRLIDLPFTASGTTITATAPTSPGAAPPGYYMLFILDSSGVPSVAKFVQLLPNPTNQPPVATITNPTGNVSIAAGQSVTFASTATDPDGSIAKYFWNFPGASPNKSFLQNPGAVTFAIPGTYTVSLTVFDNVGANNPSPPTVTVTVGGSAPALGAAITSPANGATVSGTVTVNMAASNAEGSPTQFLLKLDDTTTLSNQSVSGSTATHAWNTTGLSGTHTLNLTVTDGAGRTATAAITVTIGSGGDTTPPTVAITAPASGATVSGPSVTVSATASDNVGVASVQFLLDGATLGAADTTAPYSVTWNTTTTSDGTHTLTAVASDAAGNTTTSAPVTVTVANGSPAGGTQNVVWTSPVNVTVSGNTITKSGGCNGCWDAGAASQQTIASGNGAVEFTISAGTGATVGLSNGNAGTSGNEIKWGLRFHPGSPGVVEVRESGVYKSDWLQVAGAVHKLAVDGGVVKYYQNGTLKYTSAIAPTYPLLVDATLDNVGNAVQNAVITTGSGGTPPPGDPPPTVAITAPASGATVSGPSVTVSATATDNVGVTSVQFKVDGVNIDAADTTAPYSVSWNTTTIADGTHTLTAVATDTGGNTTTSAPVTVTVANGTPGGGTQNVVWTSPVNVAVSGNTITKNAGCDGCFDAGAVSQQTIASGDGAVEFTISAGAFLTAGLSVGNTGPGAEEIDFGLRFYPGSPGIVEVRENGVYKWDWLHVAGAVYKVAVESGVVKYSQNGTLKYTSAVAPAYPLLVDTALGSAGAAVQNAVITAGSGGGTPPPPPPPPPPPTGAQNVVWTSAVNVAVSGNTITKNAGCDGCFDAGAVSQQTIVSGSGSVEFTISAGAFVRVGLSTGNTGPAAEEIDFGLQFHPGSPGIVEVRENGAYKWDWLQVAGAVHKVAVEAGVVKYYQNGTLKYTSAVPPASPLLVDTALGSAGAAVQNAVITGASSP